MVRCLLLICTLLSAVVPAGATTTMNGAGATFPFPLYSQWFSQYSRIDREVKFNYQATGSSDGIRQILARSVEFGATDKFLTDEELKGAPGRLLHIPTVLGAVVVTYNLPGIGGGIRIPSEELADIYLGKITRWNDPKIAGNNPGVILPDKPITVIHRSDGSGTTSIFTDYLSGVNAQWSARVGRGGSVQWPAGLGGKGNEGVAALVKKTKYALGYVDLAHALENHLPYAHLKNREGEFVEPTIGSISAAVGAGHTPADYRVSLVNQPGKGSYPVVGFTWLLVYAQQKDRVTGRKLVEFLSWSVHDGQKMAAPLLYAPLPASVVKMVEKTLKEIK